MHHSDGPRRRASLAISAPRSGKPCKSWGGGGARAQGLAELGAFAETRPQQVPRSVVLFSAARARCNRPAVRACECKCATGSPGPPSTTSAPAEWLVCDSAQCQGEATRLAALLEGEPCRNFYDYACQRVDDTPPLPTHGTAASADTRLADALEDALLAYVRDSAHNDVAPARELLAACGTGSAQDLANFVAAYVRPSWPASTVTSDLSVWEAAGRLLRELGVAALISVAPVARRTATVALGPAELLLKPGDDASLRQLLSDAVRATVTFVTPSADARTAAEDVVNVLSDLFKGHDTAPSQTVLSQSQVNPAQEHIISCC